MEEGREKARWDRARLARMYNQRKIWLTSGPLSHRISLVLYVFFQISTRTTQEWNLERRRMIRLLEKTVIVMMTCRR